jgi:regulator of protease activity HflC (stomatin/prohibitin superfamily)
VPAQDVILRDNVSVMVNAVVYFRVVEPQLSIIQVANFIEATSQLAQTTLRAVLGKHALVDIQEVLDRQTDAWGIKVSNVESGRGRARAARQGDPRRRRAAGAKRAEAMQLRYLQTLTRLDDRVPSSGRHAAASPAEIVRTIQELRRDEVADALSVP